MNIFRTLYHAPKTAGIERRKAYIVGGGIAGLAAAAFLTDDAGMPGKNIIIFEAQPEVGGAMDGVRREFGYQNRGERELEAYMECLWYLCSKVPSLENPGRTVLDEVVDFNKDEPIHSECRALVKQGHILSTIHTMKLPPKVQADLQRLMATPEKDLEDISIQDFFGKNAAALFASNFWLCFHTMLAFRPHHSLMEMRRYLLRFNLGARIEYLEGIVHTQYNEYDAIIKPLKLWLVAKGVKIMTGCAVTDIDLDAGCNQVQRIQARQNGGDFTIPVAETDWVFVTNGSLTQNATFGDNTTVVPVDRSTDDRGVFTLWEKLARKHEKFGHPEKFIGDIDQTKWISFFPTIKGYPQFIQKLEELTGSVAGTGGAISIKDSAWELGFILHHKPFFPDQADDEEVFWGNGLSGENIGDYINKPMFECTGDEIMTEFLYHLGLLEMKDELLAHTYVSTCMMPYINAEFMPRKVTDRPKVVPEGCTNLGFIGQFVEVQDDAVFTVETSVRTAMEAVYQLTKLDKDVLEVYPSRYDIRLLITMMKRNAGIKGKLTGADLPKINPFRLNKIRKTILDNLNAIPPYDYVYTGRDRSVPEKESVLHPKFPLDRDAR
ncbi:MAG: oleate hydratase [Chloroflexota bacterium]|nr:MAG: oleate hydratase [Chloroflexota bacterium]